MAVKSERSGDGEVAVEAWAVREDRDVDLARACEKVLRPLREYVEVFIETLSNEEITDGLYVVFDWHRNCRLLHIAIPPLERIVDGHVRGEPRDNTGFFRCCHRNFVDLRSCFFLVDRSLRETHGVKAVESLRRSKRHLRAALSRLDEWIAGLDVALEATETQDHEPEGDDGGGTRISDPSDYPTRSVLEEIFSSAQSRAKTAEKKFREQPCREGDAKYCVELRIAFLIFWLLRYYQAIEFPNLAVGTGSPPYRWLVDAHQIGVERSQMFQGSFEKRLKRLEQSTGLEPRREPSGLELST